MAKTKSFTIEQLQEFQRLSNRLKQIDGTRAEPPFVHPRLSAGEGQHIEAVDGCRLPQDRQGVKVGADQGQRLDRLGQQKGVGPTFRPKDRESLAGVLPEQPVRGKLVEGLQ